MYVRAITEVDDMNQEMDAQVTFRQEWMDTRLTFDHSKVTYLQMMAPNRIWTPDTFISNEKDGKLHTLLQPNNLIRIYPTGRVLFSTRLSLKLACPMDLRRFPFDTQICPIKVASCEFVSLFDAINQLFDRWINH